MTMRDSSSIHKLPKITFYGYDAPRPSSDDDSSLFSASQVTVASKINTQQPTRCTYKFIFYFQAVITDLTYFE